MELTLEARPDKPSPRREVAGSARPLPLRRSRRKRSSSRTAGGTPTPAPAPAATKLRVLFVDDDERILNALKTLFRNDYEVQRRGQCRRSAGAPARRSPLPIVVSDQRMPGMTGVELLREVRKHWPRTGAPAAHRLLRPRRHGGLDQRRRGLPLREEAVGQRGDPRARSPRPRRGGAPARRAPPTPDGIRRSRGSILVIDPRQGLARGLETPRRGRSDGDARRQGAGGGEAAAVERIRRDRRRPERGHRRTS